MKKTLLLQTALVAAAGLFVADIANAQTKEVPIGVTVGGYMVRNFKAQDQGAASDRANDTSKSFGAPDAEVWFNIRGVLDNGTVVGGRIELEGATDGDQIDESYFFAERADIGRIELGSTDRVANKMIYGAPNAIPGHSTTQVSENSAIATNYSLWFQNTSNDAEGINLYTASNRYFGSKAGKGLQLGVSYVPNACQDNNGGAAPCGNAGFQAQGRENTYVAAANYLESFGSVDAAVYVGYVNAKPAIGSADREDGWQAGATFTYNVGDGSTIQLGGLYNNEDTLATTNREGFSLGLRYLTNGAAPGSIGIGIEGSHGEVDATGTANDTETDTYMLGVTYQVAKGLLTFAGVGVNDHDSNTNTADNDQTFGVVGVRIDF
jgi:outer membrane protein OmpU